MIRTPRTAALTGALTAALTGALSLAAPPAAAAEDPPADLALFAVADIWIDATTPTSATVCADGYVDHGPPILGQWTFAVVGTTTTHREGGAAASFPTRCHIVRTLGNPAGLATASVAYVGVNGDVLAHCSLTLDWNPLWPIGGGVGACTGTPPMP